LKRQDILKTGNFLNATARVEEGDKGKELVNKLEYLSSCIHAFLKKITWEKIKLHTGIDSFLFRTNEKKNMQGQ